jgi:protein TonB
MYSTVISLTSSLLIHGVVIVSVLFFKSGYARPVSLESQPLQMFEVSFHESSIDSQPATIEGNVVSSIPLKLAPAVAEEGLSRPKKIKLKNPSAPQNIKQDSSSPQGQVESSAVSQHQSASGSESGTVRRGSDALQLSNWLARHRFYPHEAKRRREEGTVVLRVTLDARGDLGSYQIVSSSGSLALDKAARDIVRRAAPYPETVLAQGNHYEIPLVFSLS